MLTQIILHANHEPLQHVETKYKPLVRTQAGIYRERHFVGTELRKLPFQNKVAVRYHELPAQDCTLYWVTPWPWLNKLLQRSMVTAWRRHKDGLPQHVAKRAWPKGTLYRFAHKIAIGEVVEGQECIRYDTYPPDQIHTLTLETRQVLDSQYMWHCVERVY